MKPDLTIIAGAPGGPDGSSAGGPDGSSPSPSPLPAGEGPAGTPQDEQCIPLNALAMPDDQEQMANPAVGDVVNYTVEGKVTRIEGGNAFVEPTAVNGKPVQQSDDDEQEGEDEDEGAAEDKQYSDLQDMAHQQDGQTAG